MRVHFIAIGGSAMHNLAIALQQKGYEISGSDDEIFEPSRSRLREKGLLPASLGWFPEKISEKTDAVILGMHAREDNPELKRAKQLGIKIFSYPEFLYEHARGKKRVVIGGSHGKTTITAAILHVLSHCGIKADFMIGAQISGFDVMVRLSEDAGLMIFEGDEYLTSALDRRPKFHLYRPHIALLSGIAWDHINVFPTWEGYLREFEKFIGLIEEGGSLVYCSEDKEVERMASGATNRLKKLSYSLPGFKIQDGTSYLKGDDGLIPLKVFGRHNLMNIEGARKVCREIGVTNKEFYSAISSFSGAANRLELIAKNLYTSVYRDFAHSPSKLKATVDAVKEQFPGRMLVACMELHTFSSLSSHFLEQYKGTLDSADIPVVYYNPHTIKLKRLPPLDEEQVKKAFGNERLTVLTDSSALTDKLWSTAWKDKNLLLMSSGNFDNIDLNELTRKVIGDHACE